MCDLLKVEKLNFKYEDKEVLNDFNLSILDKGITILCGQNGSGKTTFLNILSGVIYDENIEGNFFWKGAKTDLSFVRKNIAYAYSNPQLFGGLSGLENIKLCKSLFQEKDSYVEKCKKMSRMFNIYEDLDRDFLSYSSGMKQKLWLSVILSRSVSLYLLDEPFNTLDEESVEVLMEILCDGEHTYLVVSHELPNRISNCSRIIDIK
jgi:ABC transporter related